jgi:hypothetical protein
VSGAKGRALVVALFLALAGGGGRPAAAAELTLPLLTRSWTLDFESSDRIRIEQDLVPLHAGMRVLPDLLVTLDAAYSSSRAREGDGPTVKLEGLRRPMVGAEWRSGDGGSVIKVASGIPLGDDPLSPDEETVARLLALPTLAFPERQIERGFTAGFGASREFRWNTTTASLGIGGTYRGSFIAVEGGDSYRPASEWAATAGIDLGRAEAPVQLRFDATYRMFGSDELRDSTILDEGDQIELLLETLLPGETWTGRIELRGIIKATNETPNSLPSSQAGVITWYSGDGMLARAGLARVLGTSSRVGAQVEFMRLSGSDQSIRNGVTWAAGPWFRLPVGTDLTLNGEAAYLDARLDAPSGGRVDGHGFHVGVGLSWFAE